MSEFSARCKRCGIMARNWQRYTVGDRAVEVCSECMYQLTRKNQRGSNSRVKTTEGTPLTLIGNEDA